MYMWTLVVALSQNNMVLCVDVVAVLPTVLHTVGTAGLEL